MKIGMIAHLKHPICDPFAGGLEMHTYALCRGLRRRGHEVTLFAATGSAAKLGAEEVCAVPAADGDADAQFRQEHRIYSQLMEGLRRRDFEIIHNNSLHYLPPALAGGLKAPMVTVLHTPPFWEMEGSIRQARSPQSRFVAVSSFIGERWAHITPVDRVIANGIDLENFGFKAYPDAAPYLVWSGRIVPEKGLHLAIAAAQRAGVALRIAGPVSDAAYFERDVRPWLDETVRYAGHLGHDELAGLIGGARAVLFTPLWEEPYGLVLAEALACGTPVAAFDRGAVGEILDESCGIIVPAEDVAALARAARDVQALSRRACRRRAEAIADVAVMITQYEKLYRQMALERRPAAFGLDEISRRFPQPSGPRALLAHYRAHLPAIASEIPRSLRP